MIGCDKIFNKYLLEKVKESILLASHEIPDVLLEHNNDDKEFSIQRVPNFDEFGSQVIKDKTSLYFNLEFIICFISCRAIVNTCVQR
jgi:hypothetical protein